MARTGTTLLAGLPTNPTRGDIYYSGGRQLRAIRFFRSSFGDYES